MLVKSLVNPGFVGALDSQPGVLLPLDFLSGANAAWSVVRKIRAAYSGPLITVWRASDSAELQVFPVGSNEELDQAAIVSFGGAEDVFIKYIFDQGEDGTRDLVPANVLQTNRYPLIYTGGAVTLGELGFPVARFDGIDDAIRALYIFSQPHTLVMAAEYELWINGAALSDGGDNFNAVQMDTASPQLRMVGGSVVGNVNMPPATMSLITAIFNTTSSSIQIDDNAAATGDSGSSAPGGITIGSLYTATQNSTIWFSEAYRYDTALSDPDKTNFKNLLNDYFGMY